jgi:histidine triad (HIT) family protein
MNDCIFCKIAQKEIAAEIQFEDNEVIAFNDINPKAPIHILIIPKKHIPSVAELPENDGELALKLLLTAKKLAEEKGIAESGYRLQINVGREGGQIVPHLHLHLMGGKHLEQ